MPGRPTNMLLRDYHTASRKIEGTPQNMPGCPVKREEYHKLVAGARELVSRCVLGDDKRSICYLLTELEVLLAVLLHQEEAMSLGLIAASLADFYRRHGSL